MVSLNCYPGDGHLGGLQYLAILDNAALDVLVNVSMCTCIGISVG